MLQLFCEMVPLLWAVVENFNVGAGTYFAPASASPFTTSFSVASAVVPQFAL